MSIIVTMIGFFALPFTLLGNAELLYAFYDQPDLVRRINDDNLKYTLKLVEACLEVLKPDLMNIGEDMAYNHGSFISHKMFCEFMLPYYKELTTAIHAADVKTIGESDGNPTETVPWLIEGGIDGLMPLERRAGTDVAKLREMYPNFNLLGGFDKIAILKGEEAMRDEFERLLPAMRSGRFIPSMDHQTPPGVSLATYRKYVELFHEYARKAVL